MEYNPRRSYVQDGRRYNEDDAQWLRGFEAGAADGALAEESAMQSPVECRAQEMAWALEGAYHAARQQESCPEWRRGWRDGWRDATEAE